MSTSDEGSSTYSLSCLWLVRQFHVVNFLIAQVVVAVFGDVCWQVSVRVATAVDRRSTRVPVLRRAGQESSFQRLHYSPARYSVLNSTLPTYTAMSACRRAVYVS